MISNLEKIREFYHILFNHYGLQNWWPADSKFECILGTILTQNTSWTNAARAISNLKSEMRLTADNLDKIPLDQLAGMIRPAGYYNQKAIKIKHFVHFLNENFSGDLDIMFDTETAELREKLLGIKGIGPETADSILLYADDRTVFVVDKYTYRILSRHMVIPEDSDYSEIQETFMQALEEDSTVFNEYHALLVRLGKEHCRKKAICHGCPLEYDLREKNIEL